MKTDARGQTQIDFLIGMSVFLLAVAFTFGFVPTMIEPFSDSSGSDLQVADRSAAHLVEGALGSPDNPSVLNRECTRDFFDESANESCRYEHHAGDLHDELGIEETTGVQVTINDSDEVEADDSDELHDINGIELKAGDDPPTSGNVAVSNRIVSIDGAVYELSVRVW